MPASYLQDGRNHFTAITDLSSPDAPLSAAIYDLMGQVPRATSASRLDHRLGTSGGRPWRH